MSDKAGKEFGGKARMRVETRIHPAQMTAAKITRLDLDFRLQPRDGFEADKRPRLFGNKIAHLTPQHAEIAGLETAAR
jgi:hypothetical protein